jgi:hypothetical protein
MDLQVGSKQRLRSIAKMPTFAAVAGSLGSFKREEIA